MTAPQSPARRAASWALRLYEQLDTLQPVLKLEVIALMTTLAQLEMARSQRAAALPRDEEDHE